MEKYITSPSVGARKEHGSPSSATKRLTPGSNTFLPGIACRLLLCRFPECHSGPLSIVPASNAGKFCPFPGMPCRLLSVHSACIDCGHFFPILPQYFSAFQPPSSGSGRTRSVQSPYNQAPFCPRFLTFFISRSRT